MVWKSVVRTAIVVVATLCPALARHPGDPLRPGFNLFSRQQDIQLGNEAASKVLEKSEVIQNPLVQGYLARLGQRLVGQPEARDSGFPFRFTILSEPAVNAFALPGGPLFVNLGLLRSVENEAQLAGVIGHEMAHVILRHGTNQASKQEFLALPGLLAGKNGDDSMLGQLAQIGINLGAASILLRYSRNAESEADALGAHLMSGAGYAPQQLARFFSQLEEKRGLRLPEFLSDHPDPGNRQQAIAEEMRYVPRHEYGYETGDFARVKSIVMGIQPRVRKPEPEER